MPYCIRLVLGILNMIIVRSILMQCRRFLFAFWPTINYIVQSEKLVLVPFFGTNHKSVKDPKAKTPIYHIWTVIELFTLVFRL